MFIVLNLTREIIVTGKVSFITYVCMYLTNIGLVIQLLRKKIYRGGEWGKMNQFILMSSRQGKMRQK